MTGAPKKCILTVAMVLFAFCNACSHCGKDRVDRGPWPPLWFGTSGAVRSPQIKAQVRGWVSRDEETVCPAIGAERDKQQGPRLPRNLHQQIANPDRSSKAMHDKTQRDCFRPQEHISVTVPSVAVFTSNLRKIRIARINLQSLHQCVQEDTRGNLKHF